MSKSKKRKKHNNNNNNLENKNINQANEVKNEEVKEEIVNEIKNEVINDVKEEVKEEIKETKEEIVEDTKEIETEDIPEIVSEEKEEKDDFQTIDEIIREEKKNAPIITSSKKKKDDEIEDITKHAQRDMFMEYMPYLIIIFFVIIIRMFIATPVMVNGSSMDPTLKDGDVMLLYKLKKNIKGIKRFDIVVINTSSGRLIKRVIGLPGDKIRYELPEGENNVAKLYVNDKFIKEEFLDDVAKNATCGAGYPFNICSEEITVGKGTYFVMGDNRGDSKDSRVLGTIEEEKILGTTELILFPFGRFGKADN